MYHCENSLSNILMDAFHPNFANFRFILTKNFSQGHSSLTVFLQQIKSFLFVSFVSWLSCLINQKIEKILKNIYLKS